MLKFPADWRYMTPPGRDGAPSTLSSEAIARFRSIVLQVCGLCSDRWTALERLKERFSAAVGDPHDVSSSIDWAESDLLSIMQKASANPVTYIEALVEGIRSVGDLCDNAIPSEATLNAILTESGVGFTVKGDALELQSAAAPPAMPVPPPPKFSRPANVLISSPTDLRSERLALVSVCKEVAARLGIPVRPILWEGGGSDHPDVPPFAPYLEDKPPQDIIDTHLVDGLGGLDVYVGMIWSKMGTPTGAYRSGTEAELESAMVAQKKTGRTAVLFYQKRGSLPEDVDTEQLELVRVFAKELEQRGIRGEFKNNEDLRSSFTTHLEQALVKVAKAMTAEDPGNVACPECKGTNLEILEDAQPEYDIDEEGQGYVSGASRFSYLSCKACGWQLE